MMEKRNDAERGDGRVGLAAPRLSEGAAWKAAAGDSDELDRIIEEAAGLRPPVDGPGATGVA